MDNFWGSFRSYLIAVLIILLGAGGLVYYFIPVKVDDQELVDITPDTGYNWEDITDGMYVTLEANNIGGYYSIKQDENGNDLIRYYIVYNYSQKYQTWNHIILVYARDYEFAKWDALDSNELKPGKYLKTVTVTNYARKMEQYEFKNVRNDYLIEGVDDIDELEKLIIPYIIEPKEEFRKSKYVEIGSFVVIGIGLLILIGSIIGSIVNRY